jgi:hypothetical protein
VGGGATGEYSLAGGLPTCGRRGARRRSSASGRATGPSSSRGCRRAPAGSPGECPESTSQSTSAEYSTTQQSTPAEYPRVPRRCRRGALARRPSFRREAADGRTFLNPIFLFYVSMCLPIRYKYISIYRHLCIDVYIRPVLGGRAFPSIVNWRSALSSVPSTCGSKGGRYVSGRGTCEYQSTCGTYIRRYLRGTREYSGRTPSPRGYWRVLGSTHAVP